MLPNTEIQRQSLYQIRLDHYELIKIIEEADGEVTEEILQELQLNEKDFENKAVSYGFVIKAFENTEEIIDKEIKRLVELKNKSAKRQEMFKAILSEAMQQYGYEKIETPTLKLSFRKSEAVEITDEKLLPKDYLIIKTTEQPDKQKIKYYVKLGQVVPGAELVTRKSLQIK